MRDKVDVITAGFPCQPFSVAGKQEGWTDGRANFYDSLLDIVFNTRSKFVVFENVKRFVTHDGGNSIKRLIDDMEAMDYSVKYKVLNSNNYDVPQKRERVIIVCNNIGIDYEFPEESDWKPVLGDFILNLPESDGFEFTPEKAKQFLDETGVDALMIGRGAIGRPWLFKEVKHFLETGELIPFPNVTEVVEVLLEQIRLNLEWKDNERSGILMLRRHFAKYFPGLPNFRELKIELLRADTSNEVHDILGEIVKVYGNFQLNYSNVSLR